MLLFALHSIIPSESAENLSQTFVPFRQRKVILEFLCQNNLEDFDSNTVFEITQKSRIF